MKRFYWLLVLPYVVVATSSHTGMNSDGAILVQNTYSIDGVGEYPTKDIADDVAYALNQAHARRTNKTDSWKGQPEPSEEHKIHSGSPQKFNFEQACGGNCEDH